MHGNPRPTLRARDWRPHGRKSRRRRTVCAPIRARRGRGPDAGIERAPALIQAVREESSRPAAGPSQNSNPSIRDEDDPASRRRSDRAIAREILREASALQLVVEFGRQPSPGPILDRVRPGHPGAGAMGFGCQAGATGRAASKAAEGVPASLRRLLRGASQKLTGSLVAAEVTRLAGPPDLAPASSRPLLPRGSRGRDGRLVSRSRAAVRWRRRRPGSSAICPAGSRPGR